jgi:ABC-type antimicrobial peptide transport system permease subunit
VPDGERARESYVNMIGPGWLTALGIAIVAGRDFTEADRNGSPEVILVNETFVRKFLAARNPLGRVVVEAGDAVRKPPAREIVGVVRDAVYTSAREAVPPTMYQAMAQADDSGPGMSSITLNVRAAGASPALLTRSVAETISRINKDITLTFRPMASHVEASTNQEWIVAVLSGFFGALALLLAAVGLYGVMSYNVSRRRSEIGIRMALGAAPAGVISLVLRRAAMLVVAGLVLGTGAAVWAAEFVTPLLFGLQPRDPVTLAGAIAVLTTIGAVAAWLPARRAARIDPASVLRH